MRVDDCAWVHCSIFKVKADCMYAMFLILDKFDLLLILIRYGDLIGGVEGKITIFWVNLIIWMTDGLLGSDLKKTYLSMRYSLSPRKESTLNLSGSDSLLYLNLFLG